MKANTEQHRRGATVVEMQLVLLSLLALSLVTIDFGVGVFRYHVLASAARQLARQTVVHGELATALGDWYAWSSNAQDETVYTVGASGGTPVVDACAGQLIGCDLNNTTVMVDWLDNGSGFGDRVRVTLTSPFTPVLSFIIPSAARTFTVTSEMTIAH